MYFSVESIAAIVHSAVEMLWAPCALHTVTVGPTNAVSHSVPAISRERCCHPVEVRPDLLSQNRSRRRHPDIHLKVTLRMRGNWYQLDAGRKQLQELSIKGGGISNSDHRYDKASVPCYKVTGAGIENPPQMVILF